MYRCHGTVDFYKAVAKSCNTYFQEMGRRAGIDGIAKVAEEFGLGQKTDTLGILNETSGILPSPEWKKALYEPIIEKKYEEKRKELEKEYDAILSAAKEGKEKDSALRKYEEKLRVLEAQHKIDYNFYTKWQAFETYNTSIGQGSNNYTVIQLANYIATIANGGTRYRPYLVDRMISPSGKIVQQYKPEVLNKVSVSQKNLASVRLA